MMQGRASSTLSGLGGGRPRAGSRRESDSFALNGGEKARSTKGSKIRKPGLSYDAEEAFAMFSGAPRPAPADEVLDISSQPSLKDEGDRDGDRSSVATTIVSYDPFEAFRRPSHRQQDSDYDHDGNFTLGSARDSRYPSMHSHTRSQSQAPVHTRSLSGHSRMASSSGGVLRDVPTEEDLGTLGYLPRD